MKMSVRRVISKQIKQTFLNNALHTYCKIQTISNTRLLSSTAGSNNKKKNVFRVLDGTISKTSAININNANFEKLSMLHKQFTKIASAGGGEKAIERHTIKQKKMLVTERLKHLLDDAADFLELSMFAGLQMEYGDIPRAGIITGIGKVHGKWCLVVANDATVKGGTVYPITLQKQLRAQEIAEQNHLPTVYVIESGGAFLPLQAQIFNDGGRTFYNEAVMSSQGIPQIAIVCGNCTAGGAYVPTMADEAVMIHKKGYIFLGGPPLVQAATGEIVTAEDLGGATLHCSVSGCTDYFAEDEAEALELGRDIIATLNITMNDNTTTTSEEPLYDAGELPGLVNTDNQMDIYKVISRITDGSRFHEFKTKFGDTLITGFAHVHGQLVGIVASNGELTEPAADKGAHFVQMCGERSIPLIFLQNTNGEDSTVTNGLKNGDKLRAQAKLMSIVSTSPVPKITFIIGNGVGPVSYIMGGKAVSPHFLFCWPNAVIGLTEPQVVAQEICASKDSLSSEDQAKIYEKCNKESTAFYGASRMWNDGIVLPQDTRQVLRQCLSITRAYRATQPVQAPVIRM
ncbi:methylcrotonoyl-CoA carboxylase beta chain, mitochondrial-like [Mytilus trossulus]|uniref:methylcrotonoyl-CoA carboxylase beta chain, mitochondrial-like n=1 Tax=Mytilus trossulus TaxID=6551 RepID=UPI003004D6CC